MFTIKIIVPILRKIYLLNIAAKIHWQTTNYSNKKDILRLKNLFFKVLKESGRNIKARFNQTYTSKNGQSQPVVEMEYQGWVLKGDSVKILSKWPWYKR